MPIDDDIKESLSQAARSADPSPSAWDEMLARDSHPDAIGARGVRHRVAAGLVAAVFSVAAIGFLVYAFGSPGGDGSVAGQDDWVTGEIPTLGATFRYPPTWHMQPFDEQVGHAGFTGAVVSNVFEEFHHPDIGANGVTSAWDLSDLPSNAVVISIEHVEAGPFPRSMPDSDFPVSLSDARTRHSGEAEGLWLEFTLNGNLMGARVYFGPDASQEDREIAADVVRSIRPIGAPPAGDLALLVSTSGPNFDDAGLAGTLTTEAGCVAVSTGPSSSVYVVWPDGYSLTDEEGATWLIDDSGNHVAALGDQIRMGGGITNLAHAEPSVQGGVPSSCEVGGPDAYWFAGTPELVQAPSPAVEAVPVHIDGVPFDVCRPMSIPGEFRGGLDTMWIFERAPKEGCEGYEGFQYVAVGTADEVFGISNKIHDIGQNTTSLWPYAAFDIDQDGLDEIAVGIDGSASRRRASIVLFRVSVLTGPSDRVGVEEVTLSCGSICVQRHPWIALGQYPDVHLGAVCEPSVRLSRGIVLWSVESRTAHLDARLWTLEGSDLRATTETFELESEAVASLPDGTIELCRSPVHWPAEFPNYPSEDLTS